jgi:hypothetical protein
MKTLQRSKVQPMAMLLFCVAMVTDHLALAGDSDAAQQIVLEGLDLRRKGDHRGALRLFREAHSMAPSPMTLAQIGLAEQSLERWVDSSEHLTTALADGNFSWIEKNRALLQKALDVVDSHIGAVMVTGTPAGAEVIVAGSAHGTLPLTAPIRVAEGTWPVEVRLHGFRTYREEIAIRGGSSESLGLVLEPMGPDQPLRPERTGAEPSRTDDAPIEPPVQWWTTRRAVGVSLMIGGVAGMAAGGTLLHLNGTPACTPPPGGLCRQRYETAAPGWFLLGGGVLGALVGGFLELPVGKVDLAIGPSAVALSLGGRL